MTFIDIGGRQGEFKAYSKGFEYKILEINENIHGENVIYGDITNCPMIEDNSFDICFSNNVFEHIKEPWKAAEECARITKLDGLILVLAPFSWRYHPDPVDYFRYSHSGLTFLFERTGLVKTIISGYDISERRKDHRGGKVEGGLDIPPVDELGGWREHWLTVFIARKTGKNV